MFIKCLYFMRFFSQQLPNRLFALIIVLFALISTGCDIVKLDVEADRTQVNAGEVINFHIKVSSRDRRLLLGVYDWHLSFFDGTTVTASFIGDNEKQAEGTYQYTAIKSGTMKTTLRVVESEHPLHSSEYAQFANCVRLSYLFCLDLFFPLVVHTEFRSFDLSVNRDVSIATLQSHMTPELYQCLIETGAVNTSDVTTLDCSNRSMPSLDGVEFLYALESLNLSNNNIVPRYSGESMVPLYYLDNLRYVDLRNQPAESCYDIQDYKAEIIDSGVTVDIVGENCPEIVLITDLIDDPATLKCKAEVLGSRVALSQIKLARHINVNDTIICSNPLNSLTQIARLPGFQGISVQRKRDGSCYDFSPLSQIDNLESLATNCADDSISSLTQLTHLTIVDTKENELPDFSQLLALEELRLHRNELSRIPDLTSNTALTSLYVNENNLNGPIQPVLSNLVNLDISDNQFSGPLDLSSFTGLKSLTAKNNRKRATNHPLVNGICSA